MFSRSRQGVESMNYGSIAEAGFSFTPIGLLESVFQHKNGTPRQPTVCSSSRASLTINKSVFNNPEHSLQGLEEYSHIWCVNHIYCMLGIVYPTLISVQLLFYMSTSFTVRVVFVALV